MNHESLWKKLIFALVRITVVYSIICVAVIALAFRFLVPFAGNIIDCQRSFVSLFYGRLFIVAQVSAEKP